MPVIHFTKRDGSTHDVEVKSGTTLMEAGRDNNMVYAPWRQPAMCDLPCDFQ